MIQNQLTIQNTTSPPSNLSFTVGGVFFKANPGEILIIDLADLDLTVAETVNLNKFLDNSEIKAYLNGTLLSTLQISGMAYEDLRSGTETVKTTSQTTYYVDGDNGSDNNDGSSWVYAKQTLKFLTTEDEDALPRELIADVTVYVKGTIRMPRIDGPVSGDTGAYITGFYGPGTLSILGIMEEVQDFTITGYDNDVTNIDGRSYVDAAGEAWTPGDLVGSFIGVSEAKGGAFRPIADNTATRLIIPHSDALTGTPTFKLYTPTNRFINEYVDDPGVPVACTIAPDFGAVVFCLENCSAKIYLKNLNFMETTLPYASPLIYDSHSVIFYRCTMRDFWTSGTANSCIFKYCLIDVPTGGDWCDVGSGFCRIYRSAVIGRGAGYGIEVTGAHSKFSTWEALFYEQVQGLVVGRGSSYKDVTDVFFHSCDIGLLQSGGTIEFEAYSAAEKGPKFKDCTIGWHCAGPVIFGVGSNIIQDGCTTEIQIGDTETATFAEVNAQEPIYNAKTGTSFIYMDGLATFETILFDEYDNTASGLTAINYQDAIDEVHGSLPATTVTSVAAATYTVLVTDAIVLVNYSTTGTCVVTIPSALIAVNGFKIIIKDNGLNANVFNITVATEGAETIDGNASAIISGDGDSLTLVSDGSNLSII